MENPLLRDQAGRWDPLPRLPRVQAPRIGITKTSRRDPGAWQFPANPKVFFANPVPNLMTGPPLAR